ncbi:MAG: hypothetical protein AAFO29_23075 [Actinomycetota bacterium]
MEVQQRYADQVRFVGVPGLSNETAMAQFVEETGTGAFPHMPDTEGDLWQIFGVLEHRTYVYINDDGTFRLGNYGDLAGDVEELIAS